VQQDAPGRTTQNALERVRRLVTNPWTDAEFDPGQPLWDQIEETLIAALGITPGSRGFVVYAATGDRSLVALAVPSGPLAGRFLKLDLDRLEVVQRIDELSTAENTSQVDELELVESEHLETLVAIHVQALLNANDARRRTGKRYMTAGELRQYTPSNDELALANNGMSKPTYWRRFGKRAAQSRALEIAQDRAVEIARDAGHLWESVPRPA